MINKIASVSIYVDDQDKAIDFWTNKVSFEVRKDMSMGPGMRWIEVSSKDAETVLVLYPKKAMPNYEELKPSIVFECKEIDKTYETMKNNGVEFEGEPVKMQFGTFVSFFDESGNRFGLRG
ncbi:VOC family protein [Sporolactobacillus sp. THM7-4]|nr:VOC family protein [Sporolactobacillus sp. THM7-4]